MKIGFNPGSIVDASGAPLQGRVTVYVHDSLEKKSIYTLQSSEYVASENPVLLDTTGRIPTTLFFDVCVVDVLVQRYIGEPGQMSDASPDTDFEDFDRFEAGFDFDPDKEGTQAVETIADLKDIENPSGVVRVNCYTTPGDTFPRFYLWNPNCSASEDGGCFIADTHDASGKWCYLCEGESIKSSVYGIKPGTEETNIGAFCQAPLGVSGDYVITYPTMLYFDGGTYNSNQAFYVGSNRKMAFSCNAKFLNATFVGMLFDVDGVNSSYIADLVISSSVGNQARVHSSWFRTAKGFFACGANEKFIDGFNFFTSYVIDSVVNIYGGVIYGSHPMLNLTFTNSSYLEFENVRFLCEGIFQYAHFYGKFTDCEFTDKLFTGINAFTVSFGSVPAQKLEVDNWNITEAKNTNVWLAWANAVGMSIVDLCGRSVSTLYNSNIHEFRNGVFLGGTVSTNVNVKFTDIGGSFTVYPMSAGRSLTIDHCDNVNIASDAPFSSIVARDSIVVVSGNGIDSSVTSYSQDGGSLQATFKCAGWNAASGTHAKGKEISLRNLVANIGNFSWFDNLRLYNCTVNNPINFIPYEDEGELWLDAIFVGNIFGNNGYIAFGDSSVGNADIYSVKVKNLIIKDNVFYTSGSGVGVMMPFYSNNAFEPYIAPLQELNATYSGNIGSCPAESIDYGPNEMQDLFVQDQGTYKRSLAVRRVWNLNKYAVFKHGSGLQISADNTQSRFVTPYLYHERNVENAGDQFDVFVAVKSDDYVATSIFKAFDK